MNMLKARAWYKSDVPKLKFEMVIDPYGVAWWEMCADRDFRYPFGSAFIDDDCIVEFGVGVEDKNDVDIYDGDIVIVPGGYCGDTYYKERISVVTYGAPEFWVEHDHCELIWSELEVIGNIHENPELLIVEKPIKKQPTIQEQIDTLCQDLKDQLRPLLFGADPEQVKEDMRAAIVKTIKNIYPVNTPVVDIKKNPDDGYTLTVTQDEVIQ